MKRYNQVQRGALARHVILKSIAADAGYRSRDDELLLKHHDFLMVRYRKLLNEDGPFPKKSDLAPSLLDVKIEMAERMLKNSNMYMTPEAMKLLDGIVDLYLADFRYGEDDHARRYSDIDYYWLITTRNFREAKKQAEVLVRLLVLPGHVECCAGPVMRWCAENLGENVRFNLMFQYHPEYQSGKFAEINRGLTAAEVARARDLAKKAGLKNLV